MPRSATLVDVYSKCVNTRHRLGEVLATDFPWCEPHAEAIAGLFKAYVARKRAKGQVDFDDLLLLWWAALRRRPARAAHDRDVRSCARRRVPGRERPPGRNRARPSPDGRGLTVVGDDAQAIYGFRGADARYLHELASSLSGATVIALERNFRSVQPILNLANLVRPSGGRDASQVLRAEKARRPPASARSLP